MGLGFSLPSNLKHAVALHFMYYNFCRVHSTLRVTPAMESGLTDHFGLEDSSKQPTTKTFAAICHASRPLVRFDDSELHKVGFVLTDLVLQRGGELIHVAGG
jgi:hypothetical protein